MKSLHWKFLLTSFLLFISFSIHAQKIEKLYTADWKETTSYNVRYYSLIEKSDSVWVRKDYYIPERTLQMIGSYKDSSCKIKHGAFDYYYSGNKLERSAVYINDKIEGVSIGVYKNGMISDSAFYVNGKVIGDKFKWNKEGFLTDSIHFNQDGSAVSLSWFDDGSPSQAGRLNAENEMIGKWQFFYTNGKASALVVFKNGKEESSELFKEDGTPTTDTTLKQQEATYKGGDNNCRTFLERNLNGQVATDNKAPFGTYTVVIAFAIDITGKLTDIDAETNLGYGMENEAMRIIKKSGNWQPAYYYGRPLKAYRRQPITFQVQSR